MNSSFGNLSNRILSVKEHVSAPLERKIITDLSHRWSPALQPFDRRPDSVSQTNVGLGPQTALSRHVVRDTLYRVPNLLAE
jgi:hypothetical protein